MRRLLLATIVLAAGCSSEKPGVRVSQFIDGGELDCSKSFDALVKEIDTSPGALKWGSDDAPTRLVQHMGREAIFIITTPKHPAHPAVIYRTPVVSTEHVGMATDACAYGERKALDDDLRGYAVMDKALSAEFECGLCSSEQVWSPALERNALSKIDLLPPDER